MPESTDNTQNASEPTWRSAPVESSYENPPPPESDAEARSGTNSTQPARDQNRSASTHNEASTPVGKGDYVVQEGDCLSSVAYAHRHFWETLWNEPANSELKQKRGDGHILLPGDRVTIPPLRRKEKAVATEQRHRFRRKGVPVLFRLRLVEEPEREESPPENRLPPPGEGETQTAPPAPEPKAVADVPRSNVRYSLDVEGTVFTGSTDANGQIEHHVSPAARTATLTLNPGTADEEKLVLNLGRVFPLSTVRGVKQRLANLGFECGDRTDENTTALENALREFQAKASLNVTGKPDQATRDKLKELVGC